MSDNRKKVGKSDRIRVSTSEDYELRDWSKKFGCSESELKDAVKHVGSMAKDVEQYLHKRR
jgi:AraC-like DNA-binding protein